MPGAKVGNLSPNFTGHGNISGRFWHNVMAGARKRTITMSVTIEQAWKLFVDQDCKCALSGVDLVINPSMRTGEATTASLDRIDSSIGYVEGNIQWVHKDINMMKRIYDQNYFITMCKKVAEHNEKANTKRED